MLELIATSNISTTPTITTTSDVNPQSNHPKPAQQPEGQLCHKIQSGSPKLTPPEPGTILDPNQELSQQDSELTKVVNQFFNGQGTS